MPSLINPTPQFVSEADVRWLVEMLAGDLAAGYDGDAAAYREQAHDVVGALIGRGIDPTALRRAIEARDTERG